MSPEQNDDNSLKPTNSWPNEDAQPEIIVQPPSNDIQNAAAELKETPDNSIPAASPAQPSVVPDDPLHNSQESTKALEPAEALLAAVPTEPGATTQPASTVVSSPEAATTTGQSTDPTTPTDSATPIVPPAFSSTPTPTPSNNPKRKKLIIITIIALLVILLGLVGYIYGYYIPNKPENVWRTGFDRTAQALDTVSDSLTEKKNVEQISQSTITADYDVRYGESRYEGSLEALFNKSEGTYSVKLKNNDSGEKQEFTVDAITHHDTKQAFPEIFFRFNGLAMFGGSDYIDTLLDYENRWIAADKEYFSTFAPEEQEEVKKADLTYEDYLAFAKAAKSATNEYVFTSNPEKAILVQKSIVGPEKLNDINTYKYKAGLSEHNLQRYCEALLTRLIDTPGFKKLPYIEEDKIGEYKKEVKEFCSEPMNVKDIELDVWVDRKYKLLHQIGYQVKDGPYIAVGQTYSGGDIFNVFVKATYNKDGDTANVTYTVEANINTLITKAKLTADFDFDGEKSSAEANFQSKPHKNDIKADRPDNVVPIQEIIERISNHYETSYDDFSNWEDDSSYSEDDAIYEGSLEQSANSGSSSYFQ